MREKAHDLGEILLVTLFFPVLWVTTRVSADISEPGDGPLRVRELWDYYKRFWRGES